MSPVRKSLTLLQRRPRRLASAFWKASCFSLCHFQFELVQTWFRRWLRTLRVVVLNLLWWQIKWILFAWPEAVVAGRCWPKGMCLCSKILSLRIRALKEGMVDVKLEECVEAICSVPEQHCAQAKKHFEWVGDHKPNQEGSLDSPGRKGFRLTSICCCRCWRFDLII